MSVDLTTDVLVDRILPSGSAEPYLPVLAEYLRAAVDLRAGYPSNQIERLAYRVGRKRPGHGHVVLHPHPPERTTGLPPTRGPDQLVRLVGDQPVVAERGEE